MRKILILGNWKMNKTISETKDFLSQLEKKIEGKKFDIDFGICPSALSLLPAKSCAPKQVIVSSQDAHFAASGAYTGNVSYAQLKSEGVTWSLVGHSERREMFGDTDEVVNKKVKSLVENDMVAVLCIGETLAQFESNQTKDVVEKQLELGLRGIAKDQMKNIVIAYEPIWAIGTGKTSSAADAQATILICREKVKSLFGADVSDKVRILYGGSVKPTNVNEIVGQPDIDGALVGGASLSVEDFTGLIFANNNWFK